MTIRDDACAHIIQAAGCAAAWILENEEAEAKNALSRAAGRIARPRQRRLVHEVYMSLGDFYFRRAYRMSYESFRRLHKLLATGIKKILDISLEYGASAADCVAFEAGDLYYKLENGLLKMVVETLGQNCCKSIISRRRVNNSRCIIGLADGWNCSPRG